MSTSADSEILLEMVCATCGIQLVWKSNFGKLVACAIYADIEESMAKKEPKKRLPVQPPLIADEKVADDLFLHEMHIDPNNPPQLGSAL
jgi:hypothetical protein